MKIVFGVDGRGQTSEIGEMLRLAVLSGRANTSHEFVVIADKFEDSFAAWLDAQWVTRFAVETLMAEAVRAANARSGYPLQAIGNYMRYEACRVIDDETFLYCDCDTIFLKDFAPLAPPALVAAVAEDSLDDWTRFNSGVLLVNRPALLRELDGFYEFARVRLEEFFPGFDQAAFNAYFAGRIERLAPEMNWRPYWGENPDALVLHVHGVKPSVADALFHGTFVADRAKKDLIQGLIAGTLKHLPAFAPAIAPFSDNPIAALWMRLAERAEAAVRAPLERLFAEAASVRAQTLTAWRQGELSALEVAAYRKPIEIVITLDPGNANLRVVLSSKTLLIVLGDLVDEHGLALDLVNCSKSNVGELTRIEFAGVPYWLIEKNDSAAHVDLALRLTTKNDVRHWRGWALDYGIERVRYYWSIDDFYSEERACNAYHFRKSISSAA